MGQLTIHFRGACTHFHQGVVPGVPHRVVLANGSAIRFGILQGQEWLSGQHPYVLFPHAAFLYASNQAVQRRLQVVEAMERGVIYSMVRIEVANAAPSGLRYDPAFEQNIPSLSDYLPNYRFSPDVVLAGRAACYLDLYHGNVGFDDPGPKDARHAHVIVETEGRPRLRVTRLAPKDRTATAPKEIGLPSGTELYLSNRDIGWLPRDAPYDFLLHFLTAEEGIPQYLKQAPYGFSLPPRERPLPAEYGRQLEALMETGWPAPTADLAKIESEKVDPRRLDTAASCSDARYP